jgi:DNA adenine methylase
MEQVSEYLSKAVKICCGDYERVLKYAKKGDIVYLDPPYYTDVPVQDNYWSIPFDLKEQQRLCEYAKGLNAKGIYVLISNSDHKVIKNLYRGFKIHKINLRRTVNMSSNKAHTELLITNF